MPIKRTGTGPKTRVKMHASSLITYSTKNPSKICITVRLMNIENSGNSLSLWMIPPFCLECWCAWGRVATFFREIGHSDSKIYMLMSEVVNKLFVEGVVKKCLQAE